MYPFKWPNQIPYFVKFERVLPAKLFHATYQKKLNKKSYKFVDMKVKVAFII